MTVLQIVGWVSNLKLDCHGFLGPQLTGESKGLAELGVGFFLLIADIGEQLVDLLLVRGRKDLQTLVALKNANGLGDARGRGIHKPVAALLAEGSVQLVFRYPISEIMVNLRCNATLVKLMHCVFATTGVQTIFVIVLVRNRGVKFVEVFLQVLPLCCDILRAVAQLIYTRRVIRHA